MHGDRLSRFGALLLCCAVLSSAQSPFARVDEATTSVAKDVLTRTPIAGTAADAARWAGTYYGSFGGAGLTFAPCEREGFRAALGPKKMRLRHHGGSRFAGPQGPSSELRFAPDGARAEWVVHTLHGIHDNVWRRIK